MSKKNLLANQLNAFSESLNSTTPIKVTPQIKTEQSEETENKKNKFKTGELIQMSIIIPKTLQRELKTIAFHTETKVNTIILEAIKKDIKNKKL